jgi:hypothetical protein
MTGTVDLEDVMDGASLAATRRSLHAVVNRLSAPGSPP